MNFATDVVEAASGRALVEIARDGSRREWSFAQIATGSGAVAARFEREGLRRGDVVLTLVGSRHEWVLALVACFRLGLVALPCTEQLRPKDLELRLSVAEPRLVVCDERNLETLEAAGWDGPVLRVPWGELEGGQAPVADLGPGDPCLIMFTSGTAGEPKAVLHSQRYLAGQQLQARHWLDARAGDLVWCTAGTGWSKSARNVFVAPWLRGAAALIHDARFDPDERLELLERERVDLLCMAPTEYRVIAKRSRLRRPIDLRVMVAAGEPLDPDVLHAWHDATNLWIRDGYGQTETGQLTGMPLGISAVPGSMGIPLPGVRLGVLDGELVADPSTVPTFFLRYLPARPSAGSGTRVTETASLLGEPPPPRDVWRTGDRVTRDERGFLYFESRTDDVIISSGYRIGPFEVESALTAHAAVAEAAAVAAPDAERGSVVRAVVVLQDGYAPSDALAAELQEHVKSQTAPYKYPRIVEFAAELPRTASGKLRRATLRAPEGRG